MTTNKSGTFLKDVFAYVDVWSSDKRANYSNSFIQQLQEMGAQVSKTFNKQVTHVVFKDGRPSTWNKAKKNHVKLVSVLWIRRCQDEGMLVDEALYPALNEESDLVLMSKKHRCMQPKDTPVRTPENDRRMKSKLDKLMEAITLKQTIVVDDSAIFIDEDSGIIYSPTFKRADYMAERLKQMKEKHENISPTASQMSSSVAVKPSPENSQTVFRFICENSDENSSASVAELDHSPHEKKDCEESGAIEQDDIDKPFSKDLEKPWLSPCRSDISKRLSISPLKFPDLTINEEEGKKKQRMASVKKSQRKNSKSVGLAQSLVKEVASADSKDASKRKRRVRMDSYSSFDTMQVQPIHRFDQERPNFHWAEEKNNKIDMLGNRLCHDQSKLQSKRTRGRHSFSALARSFGSSSESCNAASSSPDAEDDVFDDFFSSVNHKKLKRSFLPLLPDLTDLDISSELDYVPKKKQRKCESAATETNGSKTSKVNKGDDSCSPQSVLNVFPQNNVRVSL